VSVRPGTHLAALATRINKAVAVATKGHPGQFSPTPPPSEIVQIRDVAALPVALSIFLVLLAFGAVGHALATAVRRRQHELAVLRALGITRWQARLVVVTQASVLALAGLAFGVPLGVALGLRLWRVVTNSTPLAYHTPLAVWALLLIIPAGLLAANLLAIWPGYRAARLPSAEVLRAE
jgi:ABC-type lipoprotein release transport system permease subunit